MNDLLKNKIIMLAAPANPTPAQLKQLIHGWENYFRRFGISDEEEEFNAIMRARVQSGCISLIAPDPIPGEGPSPAPF